MDSDDATCPNFNNAFPSTSQEAAVASWHPALRDNAAPSEERDDDFFERYPGPTPKKIGGDVDVTLVDAQSEEPVSPIKLHGLSAAQDTMATVSHTSQDAGHAAATDRPTSGLYEEDDEEALIRDTEVPVVPPGATIVEQEQALEARMPDQDPLDRDVDLEQIGMPGSNDVPEEHYEHQGEGTELEEALESSAGVSLLANEAPLPTTGFTNETPTSAVASPHPFPSLSTAPSAQSDIKPVPPRLHRAFTTNFSDSPVEPLQQSQSIPDEWPSIGDDKTFGELLGDQTPEQSAAHPLQTTAGERQQLEATAAKEAQMLAAPDLDLLPEVEGEIKEDDLAAAWGAALGDDDMLEDTPAGLDPSNFFGDDDDGFLEDEPSPPAPVQQPQRGMSATQYRPADLQPSNFPTQTSMPSPQFFNPSGHGRSAGTPSTGLFDVHNQLATPPQPLSQPRPSLNQQAQSFSDKAKGGYQSPYDLPMEVVKPRRRPQQPPTPAQAPVGPPIRSSSIGSTSGPPHLQSSSVSSLSPPPSRGSEPGGAPVPAKPTPKTSSGFFEELPMTAKPRARPSGGYTPQPVPGMPTPPPQAMPLLSPSRGTGTGNIPAHMPPTSQPSNIYGGLRQPERLPLLPDQPSVPVQQQQPQPPRVQQAPPANTRYSPSAAASASAQLPAAAARYSPAPGAQPLPAKTRQPSAPINPFAPRTSSPLAAYTDKPHPPLPADQFARNMLPSSPPKASVSQGIVPVPGTGPRYSPASMGGTDASHQLGSPPAASRTSSPEMAMKQARMAQPAPSNSRPEPPRGPVLPHRRRLSREFSFAPPQDERAADPLQRWKGHPVFKWSASGAVLSTFPQHTPFYAAGQGMPSVKASPGPISVQDATQFLPMDEWNAKFPGPLPAKSKGRKKDVLAWMATKIEHLERQNAAAATDFSLPLDLKKRREEKMILWKTMRIFVEHDGSLDGNSKINDEVRGMLLPDLAQMAQVAALQGPASAVVERDAVDKHVTLQLRQALLEGRREQAVWIAEEKKLWGHAMLIASTMGPEIWRQIVQAFVRNQVKGFGSDARSLAALYQVFAGNSEECVDELVPPSARAGFQMINMADGSVAGNPLEGLDQWRETLALVTSNRTANDSQSLVALGKMLAGYGRVEAAHTCFLFARASVKHSGPDDVDAHFVLLGANHQSSDESFGTDLDSILLTEVYEYAVSLSAPTTSPPYIPHLQAFKLVHAQELAAYGLTSKAQTYCDAITSAYTSTTRPSPYYHPTFTQAVAETSAFLSQTPHDGKSGFLSRPALNKVSSSATNWFTKFVAGEDEQDSGASASGSNAGEGPFGGVNGDSGTISRNASGTDLYTPMIGGLSNPPPAQPFHPSSTPSRYTPGAPTSAVKPAPAQPYSSTGIPSAEPQRPGSSRYAPPPSAGSALGIPGPELVRKQSNYSLANAANRRDSAPENGSQSSYEPRPVLPEEGSTYNYSPQLHSPPAHSPAVSSPLVLAHQPPAGQDAFAEPNGLPEQLNIENETIDADGHAGYMPPTEGYQPPSYSYQPYEPEPDSPDEVRPKKTFGDEDDDEMMEQRAAALKKAQVDREADDAFRKAAEADAARDSDKGGPKKGWFGGWFAGKQDGSLTPGPIKAKLGEENSFYFDKDLGKWVNKKGGAEAAAAAASPTPPPPRGPPGRVLSGSMGPPSGPPSRNSSGNGLSNIQRPPTSGSGPSMSGPPSRTGTPASNPGPDAPLAPPIFNGEVLSAVAPLRPTSSLSNASSLDDLLGGPPGPRKAGGTVKSKKKGGRYVDVMAK